MSDDPQVSDDKMAGNDLEDIKPMSNEEAHLVTLMRIYDVLLGIYNDMDSVKAEALMDIHADGKLMGPVPYFNIGGMEE